DYYCWLYYSGAHVF
nr:immunoglobulin light chain junction region [Macaca mulatta]MOW28781.1 immunoglobulin light chain junction region [Macaca mulatta]MOW30159.1 immunoglobulin light chain junction region [Macaca mulatta]